MITKDMPAFTELWIQLADYYQTELSVTQMNIRWELLKPFAFEAIKAACQTHIIDSTIGHRLPEVSDLMRILVGTNETRAFQAWALVKQALCQIGVSKSVVFEEAIIHAVIEDMGGWVTLGMTTTRELSFREREFCKRYVQYIRRPPTRYPRYLAGFNATQQASFPAHPNHSILFIGNSQKAYEVMQKGVANTQLPTESAHQAIQRLKADPTTPSSERHDED